MKQPISITSIASISALGSSQKEIWNNYLSDAHFISEKKFNGFSAFVAQLSDTDKEEILALKKSDQKYKKLDDSVLFAIFCGRKAVEKSGWKLKDNFGINVIRNKTKWTKDKLH